MQFLKNPNKLPLICGGLGLVGLGLRFWLLQAGMDDKGLLSTAHPAHYLITALVLLAIAAVAAALWDKQDLHSGNGMFPASRLSAAAAAAACIGLALGAWENLSQAATLLEKVSGFVGFLAAFAAAFLACCRFNGLRPHFIAGGIITVYLVLHVLHHYQQWFSEPQLSQYFPRLMAQVLLMLACYHKTALEAGLGGRKMYIITSQLAGLFCLISVPGAENSLFYLTLGAWMLLDAGDLTLPPHSHKEAT